MKRQEIETIQKILKSYKYFLEEILSCTGENFYIEFDTESQLSSLCRMREGRLAFQAGKLSIQQLTFVFGIIDSFYNYKYVLPFFFEPKLLHKIPVNKSIVKIDEGDLRRRCEIVTIPYLYQLVCNRLGN